MALLLVIRLRGKPDRSSDEEKALELLRLHKVYHAVLVQDAPSIRGMLEKTLNSVVTYGEVRKDVLVELLKHRARLTGNRRPPLDYLKSIGYDSFESLADALLAGKISINNIPGLKPVFRLRPPSGGFKGSIRKNIKAKGETGYRGEAINELVLRML